MGLGGGLVKKVFCKNKSSVVNSHQDRSFGLDKSKWTAVRLYLCGDELNSVIVENDSDSSKSSVTSVFQSLKLDSNEENCHIQRVDEYEESSVNAEEDSYKKFSEEDDAAILIQSAFRGFMARRRYAFIKEFGEVDGKGMEDQSGVIEDASIEVLVDGSMDNFSFLEENGAIQHKMFNKSRSQAFKLKEDWDDSTLSSDTQKLRIQNKLEATTRRERALAYAFSQQLRTCTMKKKPNWTDSSPTEPNPSWTWLERWMATRVPDSSKNSLVEDYLSTDNKRLTSVIAKKRLDVSIEGKESCGSNDVPVTFEDDALHCDNHENVYGNVNGKFKSTRSMLRRKSMPNYHRPMRSIEVNKRASYKDQEERRQKQAQQKCGGDTKYKDEF